ncbi:DUF2723 domain-containing protein [Membranicola marinus]|uniref:DUF2723 domain-containing protein n=1 Tax=Membranihabitans marinus TaxID=1227546 RepID=A0A953HLE7_9BACT|nr:DUF2723 domain-containing protein [Membranihabitans marinus]MBY5957817.1 DUF2723 domain-containing protein [Membranihabitans marinus]
MNNRYNQLKNIAGWAVFVITFIVFAATTERTGSLWDVGEFIAGAYKLQVVHPPGAPLFLLIGRIFTLFGELFSSSPSAPAFAVNLLSAFSTSVAAMFAVWICIRLSRHALVGRHESTTFGQDLALILGGVVAGFASAFATSVWFSAVEGEVYALSTFFTMLTLWATVKWYTLPESKGNDRWLLLAFYAIGLSIGVHLLSVLAIPSMALFYYYKKSDRPSVKGFLVASVLGLISLVIIQKGVIVGLPLLWSKFELFTVNSLGMPIQSGLIPLVLLLIAGFYFGLRYAWKNQKYVIERALIALMLVIIGYSTIMVVVLRAGAEPPINMNNPDNVFSLIPYINREQYGERAILKGPQFDKDPIDIEFKDRYGRVGDRYEITNQKANVKYRDQDEVLFPRMSSGQPKDVPRYRAHWMKRQNGSPTLGDNINFFIQYQVGWMYIRYFMWNFTGRHDGNQGYVPWNWTEGHWVSGIPFIDKITKMGFYDYSKDPDWVKADENRNFYFYLPLIFGLIGFFWQYSRRRREWVTMLAFFVITGIGIIVYSNQPPIEPRERDYVLVGSFFAFAIWMGMAVPAIYERLAERMKGVSPAVIAGVVVLIAPALMAFNNYNDHNRRNLHGARDSANNFLESCAENAIIFTYGDNDTYPLWYAQEVEGIRTDVRVVNLSLIPVDWYIDGLRRKLNDSPPIKFTFTRDQFRGSKRNNLPYREGNTMPLKQIIDFAAADNPTPASGGREFESFLPSNQFYIEVDRNDPSMEKMTLPADSGRIVSRMTGTIDGSRNFINKGQLAVLDIIASNWQERPIYWSLTAPKDQLYGLQKYLRLEGLGQRLVPVQGQNMVNLEVLHDHIMNDFRWGGLDKYDQTVADGFRGTIMALKNMFGSGASDAVAKMNSAGTEEERQHYQQIGIDLIDKYFAVFPDFNFPYDGETLVFVQYYNQLGVPEQMIPLLDKIIDRFAEQMVFYRSISQSALNAGFGAQKEQWDSRIPGLANLVVQTKDPDLVEKLHSKLGGFADLSRFNL